MHRFLNKMSAHVSSLRHKAAFLRFFAVLLLAAASGTQAFAAGDPSNGQTIFNTANYCITCHTALDRAQANHANAPNDIAIGIAGDYGGTYVAGGTTGMGRFSAGGAHPLTANDLNDLASYIGWFKIPTTADKSATVAFNSGANSIDLTSSISTGADTGTPKTISIGAASHGTASGATISAASGSVVTTVSYTPTVGYYGPDSFTYTVSNNAGSATTRNVNVTVSPPLTPVVTSAGTASGNGGQAFSYQITANNYPTSFSASGLPTGVTVDTTTGLISGTPTVIGTFNATVHATNVTGTGNKAVTITISAVTPVVTSAGTASGNGGQAFSYQITASNLPTSYGASGLPSGVTVDTTTGLISGTPTVIGTFNATVSASNTAGTGNKSVTITISAVTPVVTSAGTASGNGGQAFSYQITASNLPASFSASGLPTGVTIDTTTGLISGTPTVIGTFNATVHATNVAGTGNKAVTITISAVTPVVTSAGTASGNGGQAFSYQITASNLPTSFSASGLPTGVTVDTTTGLISGTPTVAGSFSATIGAANTAGNGTKSLTITISTVAPVITSAGTASGNGGQAFSYQITANNLPSSFSASGLPSGVTVNTGTGLISGTPTVTGTFSATISASNGSGTDSKALAITINVVAPVITSAGTASGNGGQAFSYQITANNLPSSYSASGLPSGVTVNTSTGLISGTPTVTGSFSATIGATNSAGSDSKSLTITLASVAPIITSAGTANGNGGQAFSYQITASGLPTSFNATGLPAGLNVNTATGLISGTSTVVGNFNATISASNSSGTGSHALSITLSAVTPVVTSAGTASGTGGQSFSYQIAASNLPTSFNASGLPAGLSVNTSTGLISGTPSVSGTFNATISASNTAGTGSRALTITLSLLAPVITSANAASGTNGQLFSYQITASRLPTSFGATGLPNGLTINTGTGLISGTPTAGGSANATISATNASGTGSQSLAITIGFIPPVAGTVTTNVAFNTSKLITLPVTGQFTQIVIMQQPAHGTVQVPNPSVATVRYTPTTGFSNAQDSFTYKATGQGGAGDSQTQQVTVAVGTLAPTAYGVPMRVPLNTPTTLDFAPYIGGSGITGVSVPAQPSHGTVAVNGTKVTYSPANNYFGDDTFSYIAYGNAGASSPAKVSVSITGRPDPTKDATVTALIDSQVDAAKRFSKAQISNFQGRMEYLHRPGGGASSQNGGTFAVGGGNGASRFTSGASGMQSAGDNQSRFSADSHPAGAAYHPAASLSSDPSGRSTAAGVMPGGAVNPGDALAAALGAASGDKSNSSALAAFGRGLGFVDASMKGKSLDLSALNAAGGSGGGAGSEGQTNVWIGGTLQFGDRSANVDSKFTSDGISIGVDRRFTKKLALGIGVGVARDDTDIGAQGSNVRAKSTSFAAYSSYQVGANTYIDSLLGYGGLHYESERFIEPIDAFASDKRNGHFYFGSTTAAYEYHSKNFMLSPYGRLDLAEHQLDKSTETGAGSYALTYERENIPSTRFSLGLRAEAAHETSYGWMKPRLRLEWQHEFQNNPGAELYYADDINGPRYSTSPTATKRDATVVGLGGDYILRNGLNLGIDYQLERRIGSPDIQAINLKLMYSLDGKSSIARVFDENLSRGKGFGLQADAGYLFDDNVSRASNPAQKLEDSALSSTLGKSFFKPLGAHTRLGLNASIGGEKFHNYDGLSRFFAVGQGELQYRSSGDYSSPIFGLFGSLTEEQYRSALRDGYRYSYGVSLLEPLSDRLSLKGILKRNVRRGRSDVYHDEDYSGSLNVDYALLSGNSLYVNGEYRKGDVVGFGAHTLANIDMAEVFRRDDVFVEQDLYSYRFDGKTRIVTLGYVVALGPKDSLDLSWRRAVSRPSWIPSFAKWDRYESNQFSIVYVFGF